MKKSKKISMSSALLVIAMLSLVGVGFALEYQGSDSVTVPDEKSEFITVEAVQTGFTEGIYTVNTVNAGANVFRLSNLKFWESPTDDTPDTPSAVTGKHFVYSSGFSLVSGDEVADGYSASVVGTATVTVTKPADTEANTFSLNIDGASASVVNPNGLSLVYTYKIGTGAETVVASLNGDYDLTTALTSTSVDVVITAYVVYSTLTTGAVSSFALTGSTLDFVATSSYVAP